MAKQFKYAARNRQTYTNETYCQARNEIRVLPSDIPFIPSAAPAQAEFEMEFLDRIGYGVRPQSLDSSVRHPFGIISVIPREQELELSVNDDKESFPGFVSRIAPTFYSDRTGVSGIAGLRVSFTDEGAILRRLHGHGKIILRRIKQQFWEWALDESFGNDTTQDQYLGSRSTLHEFEKYEIETYPPVCDTERDTQVGNLILSGILRRPHLFRARTQMRFTDLWFNHFTDNISINIEWAGDLPHCEIIKRITDRKFGLPLFVDEEHKCYCEPCTANTYRIQMRDSVTGNIELNLRRSSLYEKEMPSRRTGPCQFSSSSRKVSSQLRRGA